MDMNTVKLTKDNMKLLGRAFDTGDGIELVFPGDGVEFTVYAAKELTLTTTLDRTVYLTAFVDGTEVPDRCRLKDDEASECVIVRVREGKHTIRIVQDSEVGIQGGAVVLKRITGLFEPETLQPTAQKKLYVEFVGDSITAGCGTLGNRSSDWHISFHAGSKAYSYQTAELLNADYSIIAKGGIGLSRPNHEVTVEDMFLLRNGWKDRQTPADLSRVPQVIICALGDNDSQRDPDTIVHDRLTEFAGVLRQRAPEAKIVFLCCMMMEHLHAETIPQVCEELGGAAKNYYALRMPTGSHGAISGGDEGIGHPSAEDDRIGAVRLASFLREIL